MTVVSLMQRRVREALELLDAARAAACVEEKRKILQGNRFKP